MRTPREKVKRVHLTRDLRGGITSVFPLKSRWGRGQTRTYTNDTFSVIEEFVSQPLFRSLHHARRGYLFVGVSLCARG